MTQHAPLPFLKMHGLGNDFVIIDRRQTPHAISAALVRAIGDRNRGVGFDQLAVIDTDIETDARLTFYNSDGSTAGACGNATRCIARLLLDESGKPAVHVRTERGVLRAEDAGDRMTRVNMGPPLLAWDQIPLAHSVDPTHLPLPGDPIAVGMGNPHCVFFVQDAESVDVATDGPGVEHHPLFPQATNVEYASLTSPDRLRMRVWERGTGITLACGSGTCATAVAAHLRGLTGKRVIVDVDGGTLEIDWRDDGVWMTGPTALVFSAEFSPAFLDSL
ncbi:MAG: diaminopimelate epimerase [Gemmobacter sp.]|nr:diaminopimelate epimerase [Gemmobacter sp.]